MIQGRLASTALQHEFHLLHCKPLTSNLLIMVITMTTDSAGSMLDMPFQGAILEQIKGQQQRGQIAAQSLLMTLPEALSCRVLKCYQAMGTIGIVNLSAEEEISEARLGRMKGFVERWDSENRQLAGLSRLMRGMSTRRWHSRYIGHWRVGRILMKGHLAALKFWKSTRQRYKNEPWGHCCMQQQQATYGHISLSRAGKEKQKHEPTS